MNKKRNLYKELNIAEQSDSKNSPLEIDIEKIKGMVNNSINSAYSERKNSIMKSKKKFSLIAAAAILVLGATVFAATGLITSWESHSSSIPEYTSLPSAKQCIKDIGYEPVLIDAFENGYTFKNGSIVNNAIKEGDTSVEKFKSVMFRYEKDGDTVIFSQDKFNSQISYDGDIASTLDGVDIYYYSYTSKVVPPDYEQTEEDKKAEESGELIFSYGSDEVEIKKVQSACWSRDGVRYSLLQIDGKLSDGELIKMAEEIIAG